jgi:hypothetical protein
VFLAVDANHRPAFTRELSPDEVAEALVAEMWRELHRINPEHSRGHK